MIIIMILILLISVNLVHTSSAEITDHVSIVFSFYGPIWDINHDGICNYLDVSSMVSNYGATGEPHWIREDMAGPAGIPDGKVNYLDVSLLVSKYGQKWVVE